MFCYHKREFSYVVYFPNFTLCALSLQVILLLFSVVVFKHCSKCTDIPVNIKQCVGITILFINDVCAVSYTHLDVYKRQLPHHALLRPLPVDLAFAFCTLFYFF